MLKGLKPDPTMCCNGMLAGLVAITAPCAFIDPWAAAVIGLVAGWLVVVSVFFWNEWASMIRWALSSVHGVNGLWEWDLCGYLRDGQYGAGWNGVVRDGMVKLYGSDGVRGLLYVILTVLHASDDASVVAVFGFAWPNVCSRSAISSHRFVSAKRLRLRPRWSEMGTLVIRTSCFTRREWDLARSAWPQPLTAAELHWEKDCCGTELRK